MFHIETEFENINWEKQQEFSTTIIHIPQEIFISLEAFSSSVSQKSPQK